MKKNTLKYLTYSSVECRSKSSNRVQEWTKIRIGKNWTGRVVDFMISICRQRLILCFRQYVLHKYYRLFTRFIVHACQQLVRVPVGKCFTAVKFCMIKVIVYREIQLSPKSSFITCKIVYIRFFVTVVLCSVIE